jgi:hypothetical protein
MSRPYRMKVTISGHRPRRIRPIQRAAHEAWPFGDWRRSENEWSSGSEGNLGEGDSEEEFVVRLSNAVWRANGAFCKVEVRAACLESLPVEDYCLDRQDYVRLMQSPEIAKSDL